MKKRLFRHYQDTPFEVLSVVLFSVLTFGVGGAALAHSASQHGTKVHQISRKSGNTSAHMLKAFTEADAGHDKQHIRGEEKPAS